MITSVTVDGGTNTVIVTGASVMTYVDVTISVTVSLITGGKGATVPIGDNVKDDANTGDIEDADVIYGSTEKIIPSMVVIAESAVANEATFAGEIKFPVGLNSGVAGAAKVTETPSVDASNSEFENIQVRGRLKNAMKTPGRKVSHAD